MANEEIQANPDMVILARESRGLTQKDLAERMAVSQGWLSRVESGLRTISEEALNKLAESTEYPPSFFLQSDRVYGVDVSTMFHRKRQDIPIRVLNRIHAQINIRRMQVARLLKGVDLPELKFRSFELSEYGNPEEAARAVRAYWRLPHGPIQSLVQTIEDAGGIVIPMDFGTNKIDAIYHSSPGVPPLFFTNVKIPGDRLRFTLCHELAHAFMHQDDINPEMEKQADRFAAQFLMPEREIRPLLTELSLQKLAQLKLQWKVSMAALLKRAGDLGAISDTRYRSLWIQLAPYRTIEPPELNIPSERPSLLQEVIDTYRDDLKFSSTELAKIVHLTESETRSLYPFDPRHLRALK